jgi:hypothetical protein
MFRAKTNQSTRLLDIETKISIATNIQNYHKSVIYQNIEIIQNNILKSDIITTKNQIYK